MSRQNDSPILFTEHEEAFESCKKTSSPEKDGISAEIWAVLVQESKMEICRLLNVCFTEEAIPNEWKTLLRMIEKDPKNNLDPKFNRPITLLDDLYKIYTSILNNRLMVYCIDDGILLDCLIGNQKGLSAANHLVTLLNIIK